MPRKTKPRYSEGVCAGCKLPSLTLVGGQCQTCRDSAQLTLRARPAQERVLPITE